MQVNVEALTSTPIGSKRCQGIHVSIKGQHLVMFLNGWMDGNKSLIRYGWANGKGATRVFLP